MRLLAISIISFAVVSSFAACGPKQERSDPTLPNSKTADDYAGNYGGIFELKGGGEDFSFASVMQLSAETADVVVWADVADLIAELTLSGTTICDTPRFRLAPNGDSGTQIANATCQGDFVLSAGTLVLTASGGIRVSISITANRESRTLIFTGQEDASALRCSAMHRTGRCAEGLDGAESCVAGTCCALTNICGTTCCGPDQRCFGGQCIDRCFSDTPNGWCDSNEACVKGACCASTSICGTNCCNDGETCNAGHCIPIDTRKTFGLNCDLDSDCLTNICYDGYCSKSCTQSSTCAAESTNPTYWCIGGSDNVNFCERSCNSTSDCTDIGAAWSCNNQVDTDGLVHGICGAYENWNEGWQCKDNAQCSSNSCNGNWCSGACASDNACGDYAWCVLTNAQSYRCFPNCADDSDCTIFGSGIICQDMTTRDGTATKICSR